MKARPSPNSGATFLRPRQKCRAAFELLQLAESRRAPSRFVCLHDEGTVPHRVTPKSLCSPLGSEKVAQCLHRHRVSSASSLCDITCSACKRSSLLRFTRCLTLISNRLSRKRPFRWPRVAWNYRQGKKERMLSSRVEPLIGASVHTPVAMPLGIDGISAKPGRKSEPESRS